MHVFINECSFHGQFQAREQVQGAITRFLQLVEASRRALGRSGGQMWRSDGLGNAFVLQEETLHQSLNHIAGKELMQNFKTIVYDMASPAPWEPVRSHSSDDFYEWETTRRADTSDVSIGDGVYVTDTSVAELAEQKLRVAEFHGCLINVDISAYSNLPDIDVLKVSHARIAVPSCCTVAELEEWLRRTVVEVPPYTATATDPPRDEQTCLVDCTIYEPAGRVHDHRKIYRHKTNRQFYYVDNLHFGTKAHLEVFDKFGRKHLGEASLLTGQIQPNTKKPSHAPIDVA